MGMDWKVLVIYVCMIYAPFSYWIVVAAVWAEFVEC